MKRYVNDLKMAIINDKKYLYEAERLKNDINGNSRYCLTVIDIENNAIIKQNVKCYENEFIYYIEKMLDY